MATCAELQSQLDVAEAELDVAIAEQLAANAAVTAANAAKMAADQEATTKQMLVWYIKAQMQQQGCT